MKYNPNIEKYGDELLRDVELLGLALPREVVEEMASDGYIVAIEEKK